MDSFSSGLHTSDRDDVEPGQAVFIGELDHQNLLLIIGPSLGSPQKAVLSSTGAVQASSIKVNLNTDRIGTNGLSRVISKL